MILTTNLISPFRPDDEGKSLETRLVIALVFGEFVPARSAKLRARYEGWLRGEEDDPMELPEGPTSAEDEEWWSQFRLEEDVDELVWMRMQKRNRPMWIPRESHSGAAI